MRLIDQKVLSRNLVDQKKSVIREPFQFFQLRYIIFQNYHWDHEPAAVDSSDSKYSNLLNRPIH